MAGKREGTEKSQRLRLIIVQLLVVLTTFKWVCLAVLAGVMVGIPTAGFLLLLGGGIDLVYTWPYFFWLIPVGFFLSALIVQTLAPDAKGHGTEKVIEALHEHDGHVKLGVVPVKMVATLVTLILGGSAGKEGPSAQIGAGVASGFASLIGMNRIDRQRFVLCGISAGFAGVFGTPIAGALFAAEVLSIGRFYYNRLLPSLIASYISFFVTRTLGVSHLTYSVEFVASSELAMLGEMVGFGLAMGLLAILFIVVLHGSEKVFAKIKLHLPVKGLLGGGILILIVLLTGTTNYVGLGTDVIDQALDGEAYGGGAPFLKMITTSVTLSAGGSGGILTPIFFIGATAGNLWAQLGGSSLALYSAIGMVTFLAAATNTPLASIMMAMELFGVSTGAYAAVACAVAYLIVGHLSVYPSQIIAQKKTFFSDIELHEVDQALFAQDLRGLLHAFFTGYRDNTNPSMKPEGPTVAELMEPKSESTEALESTPKTPQERVPAPGIPHNEPET